MGWRNPRKLKIVGIIAGVGLLIGALGLQVLRLWLGGIALGEVWGDVHLEGISLEAAQRRTPFPICFPERIPEGLEGPSITYHADFGDPMEATVSLKYQSDDKVVLQIDQHLAHAQMSVTGQDTIVPFNSTLTPLLLDLDDIDVIKRRILAWQVGWRNVEVWLPMAELHYYFLLEEKRKYLVTELTNPIQYHAYLVYWSDLPLPNLNKYYVSYELFSHLSETKTLNIARSIARCVKSLWQFPDSFPTPSVDS